MKTKRFCKSTVSLLLVVMMLMSIVTMGVVNVSAAQTDIAQTGTTIPAGTNLYLDLNWNDWTKDNARIACYVFSSSGNKWYNANKDDGTGYYYVTIKENSWDTYIWVRMNGANTTNDWSNKWNQTDNVVYDGNSLFKLNKDGDWNQNFKGTTVSYTPDNPPSGGGDDSGSTTEKFPITIDENDTTTVYVLLNNGWSNVNCHAWQASNNTNTTKWPGEAMTKCNETFNGNAIYTYSLTNGRDSVIFNNGSEQTGDMAFQPRYYYDLKNKKWMPMETTSTTPGNDFVKESWDHISFRDDAQDSIDDGYDTNIFVSFDSGEKQPMTKVVDTMSGHDMWYIEKPATNPTTVKFYATKATDEDCSSPKYTWTAAYSGCTTGVYCATGASTDAGHWGGKTEPYALPDLEKDDIENLSFGIWVDTKGNGKAYDAVVARKVNNNEFHLYLPDNTPANPKVYTSFKTLSIGGTTITNGTPFNFGTDAEKSFNLSFLQTEYDAESNKKTPTLKVYRTSGGVATLFLQTNRELFTEITNSMVSENKDAYKVYKEVDTKGNYYLYDESGSWVNAPTTDKDGKEVKMDGLKKLKGRGNSTFNASMQIYGKYAYNITLNEKIALAKDANPSTKWCLLANNVDHSMMRNSFIYALADDIGVKYAPNTRLVNLYDNGNYLGAYVIAEKVEYGKKYLMSDMQSLDDFHEDKFGDYEDAIDDKIIVSKEEAIGGATNAKYWYSTDQANTPFEYDDGDEEFKQKNFLLEFELGERYRDELSWFETPKGQHVVVKYPEYVTKKEMEWIAGMFVAAENAVYASGEEDLNEISNLIDVDSFAKMYLIQELGLNLDSAATSYYIHNNGNKLVASPVWDYDWSFGSYYKHKAMYNPADGKAQSNKLDDPNQWFVKYKVMDNDVNHSGNSSSQYNFQAKLAQNDAFWQRCRVIWTNQMRDAIDVYIDTDATETADGGILVDEWLEPYSSAVAMNFARWKGYYKNGIHEEWGTRQTNQYKFGSYNFSSNNDGSMTGTVTAASWKNPIYYLNDWVSERMFFMSDTDDGNIESLYDESLLVEDDYKFTKATATLKQDETDKSKIKITLDAAATNNDQPIPAANIIWKLCVDDKEVYSANMTQTSYTYTMGSGTHNMYVVFEIKDSGVKAESGKASFTYTPVEEPKYSVTNVKANGAYAGEDNNKVTVSPTATVTLGSEPVELSLCTYTVKVNNVTKVANRKFSEYPTYTFDIEGENSVVVIVYAPDGKTYNTSPAEKFSHVSGDFGKEVTFTVKFKSSTSYRYRPQLSVDNNAAKAMDVSTTEATLGKNIYGTQEYKWYECSVVGTVGTPVVLKFTNQYNTSGATIKLDVFAANGVYYFGVDNLNNGKDAINLTEFNTDEFMYIRNFKQSATHMVFNSEYDKDAPTTSLNGTVMTIGDTDGDGVDSILDATTTQLALAKKTELSSTGTMLADYNLDTVVSIMDVTKLQIHLTQ